MRFAGAKKQTFLLTFINAIVRALGLSLRIWTSRLLGAEAMGVMELAQSVHMVAITPLTSGLPVAVSRLTAKENKPERVLAAGLQLVRKASLILVPLLCFLSPVLAAAMGDFRVLPSLWFSAPCILILGYSAVYNGYCYGIGRSELPALSELVEQILRCLLTVLLLRYLTGLTVPWAAAVPTAATMAAEIVGLFLVLRLLAGTRHFNDDRTYGKPILRLAVPTTLTRLFQTLLRSITAILIPARLQASGLSASEATAQLGMLNGMVSPFLMLPGIFTSALAMVTAPRIAQAEEHPHELKRILLLCLCTSVPLAFVCSTAIYVLAPFIANSIYRQAELNRLFRLSAPQMILMPLNHILGSTLSALGQQRRSLYASVCTSIVSVVLTWLLAGNERFRLSGVIATQYASQILSILSGAVILMLWRKEQKTIKFGGISA